MSESESVESAREFLKEYPTYEAVRCSDVPEDAWTDSDAFALKHWLYLREQLLAGYEPQTYITAFEKTCMLLLAVPLEVTSEQLESFKSLRAKFTAMFENVLAEKVLVVNPAQQLMLEDQDVKD